MDEADGKELLINVLNGQALVLADKKPEAKIFLSLLSDEGRLLRWLAVTLRPDLFKRLCALEKTTSWPEAAAFFYLWTPVEDYVLEALTDFVRHEPVEHMSLHFDGFR
eukprot:6164486-Heterocapsa_arctica.AAC.1